ncbi:MULTISPECIES: response regulator transcription factor [unclassified Novosphingobium]|uniref:response regulator transcription factor n=1 Tax=unclassified Novosphingobium TaxID=2644732 RepID=UPI000A8403E0|nr:MULTISPECIES: response regulator transcription factor [unclassified Novosphingobium]MBN9145737.1 response regulator transcription factor [Novosphingobium sp.]
MILIVEDDVTIGRTLAQGLTAAGLAARWLRRGAEVAPLVAQGGVEALVLDLGLPDGDGLDVCRALRADGHRLPVLMLTARGGLDDRLDGFAAGADDYLAKPFAFAELLARVRVMVRHAQQRRPDPLVLGVLEVDPLAGEARWAGQRLDLEPKGILVLAQLLRARGGVVTRRALMDAVWGDAAVTDNALDVVLSSLRKRLAQAAPEVQVRTVRGTGVTIEIPENKP